MLRKQLLITEIAMKKKISHVWPVPVVLFFVFIITCFFYIQECNADKLITFEGTFYQYTEDEESPYPSDTATHTFSLEKDGIITITVIFEPYSPRQPGDIRNIQALIRRPDGVCDDYEYRKRIFFKGTDSGEIYGPIPLAAGQYEIQLDPWWPYMQEDGTDGSYTVYINYTTSDPSIDDKDTCVSYSESFCKESEYENWGTLSLYSETYSHLGYSGCLTDYVDTFDFQVSETGNYYFLLSSDQIDVSNCSDKAKFTLRFNKISGFPHSSFYVHRLEMALGNKLYNEWVGSLSLSKNTQYQIEMSAYGPGFDNSECYAALKFVLTDDYKPINVTNIEHAATAECGKEMDINVTLYNPNNYEVREDVTCDIACTPDVVKKVSQSTTLPANRSTKVNFSWYIPRIGPEDGACYFECGTQISSTQLTCEKLTVPAAWMDLILNAVSDDDPH